MRPDHEYNEAIRWLRWGLNDCEVARLTGIPRGTIRDWRRHPRVPRALDPGSCPICSPRSIDQPTYAYLLGLYLGDGCLSEHARGVFRLRIALDKRYPRIIAECKAAIEAVKGLNAPVNVQSCIGCVSVNAYWKHWPCLFPQHGKGRKHLRQIRLVPWQQEIVTRHPDRLLRGLIHSDGWRGTNQVTVRGKKYSYPRYQFVNHSEDIRMLFCRACEDFGVGWRQMRWQTISVARREDVAKLDMVIGPKR